MREILEWERTTNEITHGWIKEYFEIEDDDEADFDWISNETGGVFEFADYYFNFSDVLNCYKHNVTKEQLFSWYDYCLENQSINISLAKFILSPEEKREKEEKHLQELKERVKFAEEEFNKALENYGKNKHTANK